MIDLLRPAVAIGCLIIALTAAAQEAVQPGDPFAAIDGEPIWIGQLNLILVQRLGVEQIGTATDELRRATALLLVRQHLAMRSLQQSGGTALNNKIQQRIDMLRDALERRNSSLASYAQDRMADEKSLLANLSWQVAWAMYLQSRLNDENLRLYFEQHPGRYGESFEQLTDQAELRRDATDALFNALVRRQQQAQVQWLIPALRPPPRVPEIPE